MEEVPSFSASVSFQGATHTLSNPLTTSTTPRQLHDNILDTLGLNQQQQQIKVLYKGKRLDSDDSSTVIFSKGIPSKPPKFMVIATSASVAQEIATKTSDPTIRGFSQEAKLNQQRNGSKSTSKHWGSLGVPHKDYKFVKLQACDWQSFGHRSSDTTPHDFAATDLLEKLSTDPGIMAIMKERELVVNTLGEMDPVDDRLMQKQQSQQPGSCLLGYNTNHGLRIDVKLRTDDLKGFRPYPELVGTLIHELSHNWVGEHDLLFWTNFAQMRAEYLWTHKRLRSTFVDGSTTAEIAGLLDKNIFDHIFEFIMNELMRDMSQHGLHPNMIAAPIRQRIEELQTQSHEDHSITSGGGQKLGGRGTDDSNVGMNNLSIRERALAAAEKRARDQQKQKDDHDNSEKR